MVPFLRFIERHAVTAMKNDSIQSKTIEWLRFFCIGAVVLLHSVGNPLEGKDFISYRYGPYDAIRILFSEGLCWVAVPIFFLISGYLFFVKLEEWRTDVWVDKLKRRVKTLLIPYLLCNTIAIVIDEQINVKYIVLSENCCVFGNIIG